MTFQNLNWWHFKIWIGDISKFKLVTFQNLNWWHFKVWIGDISKFELVTFQSLNWWHFKIWIAYISKIELLTFQDLNWSDEADDQMMMLMMRCWPLRTQDEMIVLTNAGEWLLSRRKRANGRVLGGKGGCLGEGRNLDLSWQCGTVQKQPWKHRSHFGSRYTLGSCCKAGLFASLILFNHPTCCAEVSIFIAKS